MAAISSAHGATTTTLTPPTSSHGSGPDASWSYPTAAPNNDGRNKSISSQQSDRAHKSPNLAHHGFEPLGPPAERPTRKMQSSENFHNDRGAYQTDGVNGKSTYSDLEGQSYHRSTEDQKRDAAQAGLVPGDNDKWIHRDKLARIESEELQAAGFFVPRSRAPSKQRRERSQVSYRRGTDASEQGQGRSRKNSAAVEQKALGESNAPAWDLRTPEEIAEEEANAYFTTSSQKGGSRIPVAKSSLAPISTDYIERAQPAARKQTDSSDGEPLAYGKTRSRSASASGKDAVTPGSATFPPIGKRSATDSSPKKNAGGPRKTSAPSKPPTTASMQPGRPKTRSGSGGTRPSTRSGEKQPEGDPPWITDSYKPDPRLPPDQQLLPTVARRLQQEQWEKEGKFGDVYDKEFRPINDNVYLKPPEAETSPTEDDSRLQEFSSEWPLKPEAAAKSPTLRQGSYSTMPKISDRPPGSPIPGPPRTPVTAQPQMQQIPQSSQRQSFQRVEQEQEPEPKKGGCGCCIVM